MSTTQLQLASVDLCVACRNATTLHLTVDDHTPPRLLARADDPPRAQPRPPPRLYREDRGSYSSRVPRFRARTVFWRRGSCVELRGPPIYSLIEAQVIVFGGGFDESVEGVTWPRGVKRIDFGNNFNQSLDAATLPLCLEKLRFGRGFNKPIDGVRWPDSLRHMTFGNSFNQPIARVSWAPFLQELRFGSHFNQPVAGIEWPASLQSLSFGTYWFNQPIDEVAWPSSLELVMFGVSFDQPITGFAWPESVRFLLLGEWFNRPLHGLSRSMSNLVEVKPLMRASIYSHSLAGVDWPARLERVTVSKALWDRHAAVCPEGVELNFAMQ